MIKGWLRPLLATFIGLFLGLLATTFAGENPWNVLLIFLNSSFGSAYDMGMTLTYSMPLIFTGLSVAFAFQAGLFNIGAEGQLAMGALSVAICGSWFPYAPFPLSLILAAAAAVCGGGLWGGIAGYLKAARGAHEVITTIMMNFIAAGIASYVTVYVMQDPATQTPQTPPLSASYLISPFAIFEDAPVGGLIFVALAVPFLVWLLLYRTSFGYELRTVGKNEAAAATAGISVRRSQVFALAGAGGLAGLVGLVEVLGRAGCFKLDFSPGYGFTGIAVAFLGRCHPIVIILSGLLFGIIQKGASDLEIYTQNVTSDLALILQALIILAVSAEGLWDYGENMWRTWKKRKA